MWATLSLQYLTNHQPPVVGGVVRRSATASALARHPLSGVRGYCLPVGCCVYPDTSPVANCQGSRGVVRLSAATSALARRPLPAVRGQGAGLARRHCCVAHYRGG
ncbi:hypothetical protein B296_00053977 [Ensete ventricosum]|uniref:Uncharacterized protein n=1 Tax=Ensete ventricosum TaxID=4639 RepID=A0A426WY84_ENSVE|nr:hypothetical protein B296_00053977 [Ensete ventricosum]